MQIRYKKHFIRLYTFLVLFIYPALPAKDIPKWYASGTLTGYPKELNYIGIGEGKTYQEALESASIYIASQIKISVSSTLETSQSELIVNNNTIARESFNEKIKTNIDQSLSGIEIIKNEKIKNKVFVFAVLDKNRYLGNLSFELGSINLSIESYLARARKLEKIGDISGSLDNYSLAKELIPTFLSKTVFYNSISRTPYISDQSISLVNVDMEIDNLIRSLRIEIYSGDKQIGVNGRMLPEAIIIRLYTTNSKQPIKNTAITVKYNDGEIAARGRTNENGLFVFYAVAHKNSDKNLELIAMVSPIGLLKNFKKSLANIKAVVSYTIEDKPPLLFALDVKDENGNKLVNVENKITKSIIRLGNQVSERSELGIIGNVSIIDTKEVEGKNGIQYLVTVKMQLSLRTNKSKKNVSTFTSKGKGLSKKSVDDALKKAIEKIKINQKKINKLLSKGESLINSEREEQSNRYLKKGLNLQTQSLFEDAIKALVKVEHGETQIKKAREAIKDIQRILEEKQNNKQNIIENRLKAELAHELELAKIMAQLDSKNKNSDSINIINFFEDKHLSPCIKVYFEHSGNLNLSKIIKEKISQMKPEERNMFENNIIACKNTHQHSWQSK